jgi:hypothetical protein
MDALKIVRAANTTQAGQLERIFREVSSHWMMADSPIADNIAMGIAIQSMRGIPIAATEAGMGQASKAISASRWAGTRIFLSARNTPSSINAKENHKIRFSVPSGMDNDDPISHDFLSPNPMMIDEGKIGHANRTIIQSR